MRYISLRSFSRSPFAVAPSSPVRLLMAHMPPTPRSLAWLLPPSSLPKAILTRSLLRRPPTRGRGRASCAAPTSLPSRSPAPGSVGPKACYHVNGRKRSVVNVNETNLIIPPPNHSPPPGLTPTSAPLVTALSFPQPGALPHLITCC